MSELTLYPYNTVGKTLRVDDPVPEFKPFVCGSIIPGDCDQLITSKDAGWYAWTGGKYLRVRCPKCDSMYSPRGVKECFK